MIGCLRIHGSFVSMSADSVKRVGKNSVAESLNELVKGFLTHLFDFLHVVEGR